MQYIQRYSILPRKAGAYRDWLKKNAAQIAQNQPEGWKYLGTWFTVRGFGKYDCETRYELPDYAALGAGFGNEALQKLNQEWFDFIDTAILGETTLLKSDEDVAVPPGF